MSFLPLSSRLVFRAKTIALRSSRSIFSSAINGPLEPPLVHTTLDTYFANEVVSKYATRQALVCRSEKPRLHGGPVSPNMGITRHLAWDYAEFDKHIGALARGLLGIGVKKGDRVGVVMGNNSAYACLQWACARIGAILVTLNPAYKLHELVNVLNLVGVSHLFIVPRLRRSAYLSMLMETLPALCTSAPGNIQEPALPSLRHLIVVDNVYDARSFAQEMDRVRSAVDFRELLVWREDTTEREQVNEIAKTLHHDDVINLQFTSGTTGLPKAVSLTHVNLLNNALFTGRSMRIDSKDILCNVPPLFHCFDKSRNLTAWAVGASVVYCSDVYHPSAIVDAIVEERCTVLHGVPTHFLGVLAEVHHREAKGEEINLSSLRTGIASGSSIPTDLMRQLLSKMNLKDLTIAYGMTETSPISFQTTPDDTLERRVNTVGTVHPHVRAKIVDKHGAIVPRNTPGEILVTGYNLQKGYWENEEQTKIAMRRDEHGTLWMHSGDEGILDDEGYLQIVGRLKDIIIRGGENLFPAQIENVLSAHPSISEAAAVSVPDAHLGEVVGAWIVRDPDYEGPPLSRADVRQIVAQSMNPQNSPAWVWFVGEEDGAPLFPKTASGKVMKHVLRNWSRNLAQKGIGYVS